MTYPEAVAQRVCPRCGGHPGTFRYCRWCRGEIADERREARDLDRATYNAYMRQWKRQARAEGPDQQEPS